MFGPGSGPLDRPREWLLKLDGPHGQVNPLRGPEEEESSGSRIPLQLGQARPILVQVPPIPSLLG